jgi:hypothetical protein
MASWDSTEIQDLLLELERRKEISTIDDVINLFEEINTPHFDDSYYRSLIGQFDHETRTA